MRQRLFTPRLRDKVIIWAQQTPHPEDMSRTVWEVFQGEQPALLTVSDPFDGFHEATLSASKTCLIHFDCNRDSVAAVAAGLDAVEAACREALTNGTHSRDVILNILARRHDVTPAPSVAVPTALTLSIEPAADCGRYDRLRAAREGCHGTA